MGVLLLSSIGTDSDFESTAFALPTRDAKDLTFEFVYQTLIDEKKSRNNGSTPDLKSKSGKKPIVVVAVSGKTVCSLCKQKGTKCLNAT